MKLWSEEENLKPKSLEEAKQMIAASEMDRFEETGAEDSQLLEELCGSKSVVAEIGAGIGRIAKHLAPKVKAYYFVEPSTEMFRFMMDYLKNFDNLIFLKDISLIPDDSCDLVFSVHCLQHLCKDLQVGYFSEMDRILKVDGFFFSREAYPPPQHKERLGLQEIIKRYGERFEILPIDDGVKYKLTMRKLR